MHHRTPRRRNLRHLTALAVPALLLAIAAAPAHAFTQPDQIRSRNGVLKTTLIAQEGEAEMAGKRVGGTMTFNGKFPGPTLNARPGDRIEITFVNRLREVTNFHFHGMHVSPAGNADNILRRFRPGRTYKISVKVPHDHPNGLYWYHPHLHGAVNAQVLRGLAGMISIEGGTARVPRLRPYRKRQIALNLAQFDAAGTSVIDPNDQNDATAATTVNGKLGQTIAMRPGATELWRVANMSNEAFYKIALDGHKLWVVGQDGRPTRVAKAVNEYVLAPGSRVELLVRAGHTGRYTFRQLVHTDGFNTFPAQDLLTLDVGGDRASSPPVPRRVRRFENLGRQRVDVRRRWAISFSPSNEPIFKAMINGKVFSPDRVDTRARLGQVEEWTFVNTTGQDHPMHLHTNDFQVTKINGARVTALSPIDNAILPRNGTLTMRFKPRTYTGLTVFHCHILFHEDSGMMATINYAEEDAGNGTGNNTTTVIGPAGSLSPHDEQLALAGVFDPSASDSLDGPGAGHHSTGRGTATTGQTAARRRNPEPGAPAYASATDWLLCPIEPLQSG